MLVSSLPEYYNPISLEWCVGSDVFRPQYDHVMGTSPMPFDTEMNLLRHFVTVLTKIASFSK